MISKEATDPKAMTHEPKKTTSKRKSVASTDQPSPIYFLSLEVEDVLCFKDRQVLDLSDGNGSPAQWTIILGNNGVGKTTLLRCLAGMEIKPFQPDSTSPLAPYPLLTAPTTLESLALWQEVKVLKEHKAKIKTSLHSFKKVPRKIGEDSAHEGTPVVLEVDMESGRPSTGFPVSLVTLKEEIEAGSSQAVQEKITKLGLDLLRELICYGYGATRKMGETSLGESFDEENSASLFSEKVSLINAEEWLLQTDYAFRSASGKIRDRLQKQLNQIIEILKRILPDVEEIRIAPADENMPRPRAEFLTPYGWVRLSGLGLGYRTMIAWMVDLAVRLFKRYPNSEDPLAEPAIVLVDEIDLHLHPKWQRTIMTFLTDRFPNTQFIVTAHSPLVVQAAKNANIVLLRREGDRVIIDNDPEIVENWRVDQVLTSVFELPTARSAELEPSLLRREELLSKAQLSEDDEIELQELTVKIGSLPTAESPEDIEAMNIIRRAAKLLEHP
jgi:energy-coupling factor transporter ATP-binding protein EcfA2